MLPKPASPKKSGADFFRTFFLLCGRKMFVRSFFNLSPSLGLYKCCVSIVQDVSYAFQAEMLAEMRPESE